MRVVNIDENTFMVVDEIQDCNIYAVYRNNVCIALEAVKRKNICSICGRYKEFAHAPIWTHMHHTKLDPLHPAQNLIECCLGPGSCHENLHKEG